jgi:hypothetical protein
MVRFNTQWYEVDTYRHIEQLNVHQLAWEYLRRNALYVKDWSEGADVAAAHWGLLHLENPALDALTVCPVWVLDTSGPVAEPRLCVLPPGQLGQHRQRLQALDAQAANASVRELAVGLFGLDCVREQWHSDSALRAHVRYVLHRARALRDGGYRALVHPRASHRSPTRRVHASPCSTRPSCSTTLGKRSEGDVLGLSWLKETRMPLKTSPIASTPIRYLDTTQAAERLNLSPRTLEKLRVIGGGPRFCKFRRRVRYAQTDLDAWATARVFESTSDPGYGQQP